jgi:hypothetical protein
MLSVQAQKEQAAVVQRVIIPRLQKSHGSDGAIMRN